MQQFSQVYGYLGPLKTQNCILFPRELYPILQTDKTVSWLR